MLIRLGLIFDIKFIMLQLLYGASQLRRDTSQIRVKGQIDRPISAKQCVVRNFRAAGNIIFNINLLSTTSSLQYTSFPNRV